MCLRKHHCTSTKGSGRMQKHSYFVDSLGHYTAPYTCTLNHPDSQVSGNDTSNKIHSLCTKTMKRWRELSWWRPGVELIINRRQCGRCLKVEWLTGRGITLGRQNETRGRENVCYHDVTAVGWSVTRFNHYSEVEVLAPFRS